MRLKACGRSGEIDLMLSKGHWPAGCDEELRAHVEACASCRQTVILTRCFGEVRQETMQSARMGSPSLLWWRAELRRRERAVEQASRPMIFAHLVAILAVVIAAVALITVERSFIYEAIGKIPSLWGYLSTGNLVLFGACLAGVALTSGAVYLLSDDR